MAPAEAMLPREELIEMADAIAKGRTPRCSGELAYHVLEIMTGILAGSETGGFVEIASRPPIPPRAR